MKFDLEARPTTDEIVDVFATIELQDGTRTRWTCGGLSLESLPLAGIWSPLGYEETSSAEEPLLRLSREEALGLANELYAACGLTEVPGEVETRDTWEAPADRGDLLEFFGTYDKIALERHKPERDA
jgi:hypothetical protein